MTLPSPFSTAAETWQEHWEVSGRANSTHGSYHLRNLQPGTAYWVQFVGRNHSGEHVPFWRGDIHTNGTGEAPAALQSQPRSTPEPATLYSTQLPT